MMLLKLIGDSDARRDYEAGIPPTPEQLAAKEKILEKMTAGGALLDTSRLNPLEKGASIKAKKGKLSVTDGPFIEAKEVIAGYAILQARSLGEAIKVAEDILQVNLDFYGSQYEAEMEVRELPEGAACGPSTAKS